MSTIKQPWQITKKEWLKQDAVAIGKDLEPGQSKYSKELGMMIYKGGGSATWKELYIPAGTEKIEALEITEGLPDEPQDIEIFEEYKKRYEEGETAIPAIWVSEPFVDQITGQLFREIRDGHHRYHLAKALGLKELPILERISDRDANDHRAIVQQALSEGKHIPPEVLRDYPDLSANYPHQEHLGVPNRGGGQLSLINETLSQFRSGMKKQPWTLIRPWDLTRLYRDWSQGIENEEIIEEVISIVIENLRKILANSYILLHTFAISKQKLERWQEFTGDEAKHGRWTDQPEKLEKCLNAFFKARTYADKMIALDTTIGIVHGIGSMASWFVGGGDDTLNYIAQWRPGYISERTPIVYPREHLK